MKKAMKTALCLALVMLILAGIGVLWQRVRPQKEPEQAAEDETLQVLESETQAVTEKGATAIRFLGDYASATGYGVTVAGSEVVIGYPGVYTVTGAIDDGSLTVDLGDYSGTVYLLLQGADINCSSGPALYIKQATECVVILQEGTKNSLSDGADYWMEEKGAVNSGAALYSADELILRGEGSLTVTGSAADGIRSKDGLTFAGGNITVTAVQDAVQGSDYVRVHGGSLVLTAGEDGMCTTEGDVVMTAGSVTINAQGDAVSAAGDADILGGVLAAVTAGGYEGYRDVKLQELSAKGIKAQTITVSDGTVTLSTADDGLHAQNVVIEGGRLTVSSGDDAISAEDTVTLQAGDINIITSYEAVEGDTIYINGGSLTATAEHNGLSGGDGSIIMTGGTADVTSEEALNASGARIVGGTLILRTEDIASLDSAAITGGTLICLSNTECTNTALNGALQYLFEESIAAGSDIALSDRAGNVLLQTAADSEYTAVLIASGMLVPGESYTLTAGTQQLSAPTADGLTTSGELAQTADFGRRP